LVGPDHLRFDFTHGKAMTEAELAEVEHIVNEEALASLPVTIHTDVAIADAKEMGAMALFGEKYGDKVRVVQMDKFSLELCGGIHVRSTSEVGLFKIISEASAASGVRRIEAITGERAYEWVVKQNQVVKEVSSLLKSAPVDLVSAVERNLHALRDEKKKIEKMRTQTVGASSAAVEAVGNLEFMAQKLEESDANEAKLVADRLTDGHAGRVCVVAVVDDGKITLVCKAGAEAVKQGAHAGKLVGEVASIAGGGGGGRPDFATAGARNPEKLDEALAGAKDVLARQIGA
jgi:alanyl-tRNA synthetase